MPRHYDRRPSRGLTLVELLIAIAIMSTLALALGSLAHGVQVASEYTEGYGTATQHARVVTERINRAVQQAYPSEDYPGVIVVPETIGSWRFPDTLVVWNPANGAPASSAGPPRVSELKIFCPNPSMPNELLEITAATDTRSLPAATNTAAIKTMIDGLKTSASSKKIVLTDLLRTAPISGNTGPSPDRAGVRFELELRPTASEWASYKAGTTTWANLSWPQNMSGASSALRHVWVRYELQLVPGVAWIAGDAAGAKATPFLGSATLRYELKK